MSIYSCKKDKLTGELDAYKGKWEWIHTLSRTSIWADFTTTLRPENAGYNAYVEFSNKGTLLFYIDNNLIEEVKYRIKDEVKNSEHLELELDFDTKSDELKLAGERGFAINNDTLSFIGFPYQGYEKSQRETNSGFFKRVQ